MGKRGQRVGKAAVVAKFDLLPDELLVLVLQQLEGRTFRNVAAATLTSGSHPTGFRLAFVSVLLCLAEYDLKEAVKMASAAEKDDRVALKQTQALKTRVEDRRRRRAGFSGADHELDELRKELVKAEAEAAQAAQQEAGQHSSKALALDAERGPLQLQLALAYSAFGKDAFNALEASDQAKTVRTYKAARARIRQLEKQIADTGADAERQRALAAAARARYVEENSLATADSSQVPVYM